MTGGAAAEPCIREARDADAAEICAIYNPYVESTAITFEQEPVSSDTMAGRIRDVSAQYPWLVAQAGGATVGYAYATRWRTRAAYDYTVETTVYLAPRATGRGIGRTLYAALLDALRRRGLHAAVGCIALPNEASIALHEKCGFRKAAHFPEAGRKLGRWVDVGFWQVLL